MRRKIALLVIAIASAATTLSAALSKEHSAWGLSAVRLLMTRQEVAAWDSVSNDHDAQLLIDLFWARRDPTPDTPANEFRSEIEQRIKDADKRFGRKDVAGSTTDRGIALVLFGEPDHISQTTAAPDPTGPDGSGTGGLSGGMAQFSRRLDVETWTYRNEKAARMGTRLGEVALVFHDVKYVGQMDLASGSRRVVDLARVAVATAALKRPGLMAADLAADGHVPQVALRIIVVGDSATANELLRRIQEGADFGELAHSQSTHASAQYGGYIGRIAPAELAPDFRAALSDVKPGQSIVIKRSPTEFAVVKLLTDAEAALADKALAAH